MSQPSRFPHTLLLLIVLIACAQLLCYVLPSGEYVREPNKERGDAFAEAAQGPALHTRLATAMAQRGVDAAGLAAMFQVSEDTVDRWLAGPPAPESKRKGPPIEERVGALLDAWAREGRAPTEAQIAAWKAASWHPNPDKNPIVPDSYHPVEGAGVPWFQVISSVPRGLAKSADIIFFVFLIGGMLGLMRATGAFDALIGAAIRTFGDNTLALVVGTTALFAVGSGVMGTAEEYVPFIAMLVVMARAMGLDAIVGISIVLIGYAVGYGCAPINPFTLGVAQGIAGVTPGSGATYRWILVGLGLLVGLQHLLAYCRRIQKDPGRSLVADLDYSGSFDLPEKVPLDLRRGLVLGSFALAIVLFVWGVDTKGWYFQELSALFLANAILIPFLARMKLNEAANKFCEGAAELTTTALLIGFARAIEVTLVDGQIIHTIVHSISAVLGDLPDWLAAVGMLVVQTLCNFFIPSGSGQAFVTMPIMAPLADDLGIERQVAVLAYQFGDGFTNVITPTNAALMGMLAMARVPFDRWLRFAVPLMIKLYLMAALALVLAVTWLGYS